MFRQVAISALALALSACAATNAGAPTYKTFAAKSEAVHTAFREAGIGGDPGALRDMGDGFLYGAIDGKTPAFYRVEGGKVYVFAGNLIQVDGRKITDLTSKVNVERNLAALGEILPEDTVTYKAKGGMKKALYVFTDPSCPYCEKLHESIAELTQKGVDVIYLPMPRMGVDSEASALLQAALCAKNATSAMDSAFAAKGKGAPAAMCDRRSTISKVLALSDKLGVQGTPAIFMESGEQIGGYLPPGEILKRLDI